MTLPVQQLSERVIEVRDTLMADWTPYARRGWMDDIDDFVNDLRTQLGTDLACQIHLIVDYRMQR